MSYFFFLYRSPLFLCTVFDSISSKIHEVLLMNPSTNAFVFGDFNVHNKTWLAYSDGTDTLVKSAFFIFQTQMVNFTTRIPDCDYQSPAFGFIYYF